VAEARTIDTVSVRFRGARPYTIADVPGHACFLRNMLTGAAGADVAVLVVSVVEGVEEQTRRHLYLARLLGIPRLVVAVNKMDAAGFAQEPFCALERDVTALAAGFGLPAPPVVPVSAATGANVAAATRDMPWHAGGTLLATLDAIEPGRPDMPARVAVQGRLDAGGRDVWLGRVVSGGVAIGDTLRFEPSGATGVLAGIHEHGREPERAEAGDAIAFTFDGALARGDVGGAASDPPRSATSVTGELVVTRGVLRRGACLTLRCGTASVPAAVERVEAVFNSETGLPKAGCADAVGTPDAAVVELRTGPVAVEPFARVPGLGRFVLLDGSLPVAAGVVLSRCESGAGPTPR
jgi:sulfate adenylyltransferase subunit 1 (EFTu-like GTPase family)